MMNEAEDEFKLKIDQPAEQPEDYNPTLEEYKKQLRDFDEWYLTNHFDLKKVLDFCDKHRVEVLVQEDGQYHCFIDYTKETHSGSWAIEFNPLVSLIKGINDYIKHNSEKSNESKEI